MQTNELREKYLEFFESKGCVRRPSDVLVPKWDPSVLFTPAGMNQFKDHFLGRCKLEFTRATTCQKCLRTGDIDNVGRTAYHHTFFEMLGNFSFGDYFKKEAILWAWEFLTDKKWLGIAKEKLSVTVYQDDEEAAEIWRSTVGVPSSRISYCGEEDNFWPASAPSLGPDGVCGPCSEIYYDTPQGVVEIWNLVFTQFNRVGNPPDNLQPLPSNNIDTGMGLERCAAVLQNVDTNYHIDILRPLVEEAAAVCKQKYDPAEEAGRRFRRIADHVRACTFAVHENVYPGSKEERYVIRRLLRRAVLDGWQLGVKKPFLHLLVPKVAELMRVPYPEISETTERVARVIQSEEEHFLGTIDGGMSRIDKIFKAMKSEHAKSEHEASASAPASATNMVSGHDAFEMYQTFGFPPELFETMAAEQNFGFDWDGFKREMERHGEISGSSEKNLLFKEDVLAEIKKTYKTEFVGYDVDECEAKVIAIVADGKLVDSVPEGQTVQIILDKTPFYGEKGGQVGDEGYILTRWKPDCRVPAFEVIDTQIDGDLIVHIGRQFISQESEYFHKIALKVGDTVFPNYGLVSHQAIARAHTATHILHYVLRCHLGSHAEQQGSKVDTDILRFDFTNHQAVDKEMLLEIEKDVNIWILTDREVLSQEMDIEDARKTGALMLFGEKYPDRVRVVSAGESKELCGGTHVANTSQIGSFKIISEESVSAGVRRITAITGMKAVEKMQEESQIVQQLAQSLRVKPEEIVPRVDALLDQSKKLRKQLETQVKQGKIAIDELIAGAEQIAGAGDGGVKFIACAVKDAKPNELREWVDQIRSKTPRVAVILAGLQDDDKVSLIAGFDREVIAEKKLDAVAWIREAAIVIGGTGGGRPDMAQAGGKDHGKVAEAFERAKQWLEEKLKVKNYCAANKI
ncbi:MAG: alanine--tRNA ligase [Planctomycetaceae bacterium]|nr:alanine--tRNA ligase [Planctomycetaceae bacterium]